MSPMNRRRFLLTTAVTAGVTTFPRHVPGGPGFVEKPLTHTIQEARALARMAGFRDERIG